MQTIATKSLRDGLIEYDQRKGWRGPLKNAVYSKNWSNNLKEFKLENSLQWELAIVKKIQKFKVLIETENNSDGKINYNDILWTKKEFEEILKIFLKFFFCP